jgi:hypothetical protein
MNPAENIERQIQDLKFTTSPALDARILSDAAGRLEQHQQKPAGVHKIPAGFWRQVMKSKLTKLAAAAALIALVLTTYTVVTSKNSSDISTFSLISKACAAEQNLFTGDKIVHLVSEIVIYPVKRDGTESPKMRQAAEKLKLDQEGKDYVRKVNSLLDYNWLPICSLKADGEFGFHQLTLANDPATYTITDESWFDPTTGRFARILKSSDKDVVFANSFDGQFVYTYNPAAQDDEPFTRQPVAEGFVAPRNPSQFLGLAAGLRNALSEDWLTPIQESYGEILEDGAEVTTYKVGYKKLTGELDTYWLFRQRKDDHTIAEMEFILLGQTQMLIRRVSTDHAAQTNIAWDLSQIDISHTPLEKSPKVAVAADMVIPNVSVEHMAEKADYETYIFSAPPSWANQAELTDCLDVASPPHRMFFAVYRAGDGRDVVLVQCQSYNKMMGQFYRKGRLVYTSPNGFKVWSGGPEKWWTEIVMNSAGLKPSKDRVGYGLESPAGTFPALAINGRLTEEELKTLVDNLVPAKEYLKNP